MVDGKLRVLDSALDIGSLLRVLGRCRRWRSRVDLVAVPVQSLVSLLPYTNLGHIILLSLVVVLQLEYIDCQRLLMRTHLAQHNRPSLVVIRVWKSISDLSIQSSLRERKSKQNIPLAGNC